MTLKNALGGLNTPKMGDSAQMAVDILNLQLQIEEQQDKVKEITERYAEMRTQLLISQKEEIESKEQSSVEKMREREADHEMEVLNVKRTQEMELSELGAAYSREIQMQQEIHDAEYKALIEKKLLSSLLNNVVDGIINIDSKGVITKFNKSAEKMFGYSSSEALGNVNHSKVIC
jgi:PAS domain-containing protein